MRKKWAGTAQVQFGGDVFHRRNALQLLFQQCFGPANLVVNVAARLLVAAAASRAAMISKVSAAINC